MLPRIIENFITEDERQQMLEFALKQRQFLRPNGDGRGFRQLDLLPQIPPLYWEIRQRVVDMLGVENPLQELKTPAPRYRSYLSIIDTGAKIHNHLDISPKGFQYLRCNVFLSLPKTGGLPIVEHQVYPLRQGDLLYFTPDKHLHWCEPVGEGVRVVVSYGFLIYGGVNDSDSVQSQPVPCKLCNTVKRYAGRIFARGNRNP